MNKDVPVEVAALWAFRENKRYREQLDKVATYAKQLEVYVKALEQNKADLERKLSKAQGINANLAKQINAGVNSIPIKPKNYKKALGHIKQGLNMLEAGRYADVVEEIEGQIIDSLDGIDADAAIYNPNED